MIKGTICINKFLDPHAKRLVASFNSLLLSVCHTLIHSAFLPSLLCTFLTPSSAKNTQQENITKPPSLKQQQASPASRVHIRQKIWRKERQQIPPTDFSKFLEKSPKKKFLPESSQNVFLFTRNVAKTGMLSPNLA